MTNAQGNRGWVAAMVAAMVMILAAAVALPAQTFETLVNFGGSDGANPSAGLVQGFDGNLYGTTESGGANNSGTVFKMTPAGTLTTLYSFCAQSGCADGDGPRAGLVQAANGNLYGTTYDGGLKNSGTVFELTLTGTFTTLYSFCSEGSYRCTDGANPSGTLIQAADGNFYGTTYDGGADGGGTVFEITPSGTLTSLHSFCLQYLCTDGLWPYAGLVQGPDGNFYGTTQYGGGYDGNGTCFDYGCGTVFKITPTGTLTTLYSFCSQTNCSDGALPRGGLLLATDGKFYGTTGIGGSSAWCGSDCGTVFKITPTGTLTTLYNFCAQSGCPDGDGPVGGLVRATDGNFYGTTAGGGLGPDGTLFEITPQGSLTTLHSFDISDGSGPTGTLIQDTGGALYGTTTYGGTQGDDGTVFSLNMGLRPFVETQPASGKVGAAVKILGSKLEGATAVTFNGTASSFKVTSNSLILAIVPAGATTGPVQVVKPGGTVNSNVNFQVLR